jgi:amino acid adenylation domain-containing protein
MDDAERCVAALPAHQRRLWARCVHPTGIFQAFPRRDVEGTIPARFERQVDRHAGRLAIKMGTEQWTYQMLNALANRLAWAILEARPAPGAPVAGLFEQGVQAVAAPLGVLKAGHVYVPLDPAHPPARLALIFESSRPAVLLTTARHVSLAEALLASSGRLIVVDRLTGRLPTHNPGSPAGPGTPALVVYTSGSTGRPKGVVHTHRTLLHMTMTQTNCMHICPDDRLALLYSTGVIGGLRVVFLALLNGAAVFPRHVPDTGVTGLAAWLQDEGITVYRSVPVLFRQLIASLTGKETLPALRVARLGGDVVETRDVVLGQQGLPAHCMLVVGYGSTETDVVLQHFIGPTTPVGEGRVPLGYPVDEARAVVLDDDGVEVRDGEVGELAIRSRYLALGYWGEPALTRAVFDDPGEGEERAYRTGDMVCRRPDGSVEHRGRKEWYAMIRGYRVDVGEVEHALRAMPAIADAVVVPWRESAEAEDTGLVAYCAGPEPPPAPGDIRAFLQARLPAYMIPAAFVMLAALPRTPNGKVDRGALPPPASARPEAPMSLVAPRTPVEARLATLWAAVLGVDRIGVHDNFLDLGGDSLRAMQIASRVQDTWQVDIPLGALFGAASIADMAALVTQHLTRAGEPLP